MCIGEFVVVYVGAQYLIGNTNRGSNKLAINKLARDLVWFNMVKEITLSVEWFPRDGNVFADELSKLFIPDDWMFAPKFFDNGGIIRNGGLDVCRNV